MDSDSASISHTPVEETSAPVENISSDTVGTTGTSATPHLPLEQAATTEPKEVEREAVVSSDEVIVSPDTPALEEATAPSIPAVTPPKGISDASTIPVIPAAKVTPFKNTEPAGPTARSARKRNFLQRLFSIFSRRKPNK